MQIIPVINCSDIDCVRAKIAKLAGFYPADGWVHLDVTDGVFSAHPTFADSAAWHGVAGKLSLEVHLMVARPEDYVAAWIAAGAKHVIVHVEAVNGNSFAKISSQAQAQHVEVMLAMNPETPVEAVKPYANVCDAFQILTVHPGPAGQGMAPGMMEKISTLRNALPNAIIEIDGGVNPETAHQMKAAGADAVTSGTYIFTSSDPKKAFEELKKV